MPPLQSMGAPAQQMQQQPGTLRVSGLSDPQVAMEKGPEGNHEGIADVSWRFFDYVAMLNCQRVCMFRHIYIYAVYIQYIDTAVVYRMILDDMVVSG